MDETDSKTTSETQPQSPPLSDLLSGLLGNPALMGKIKEIVGSAQPIQQNTESNTVATSAQPQTTTTPQATPQGAFPSADGLANILSDPSLIEKLPTLLAVMKPLLATASSPQSTPHTPSPADPKNMPLCRDNLLLALKPFLSPERCQAIDSMLRIAKLGEILGQLK